MRCCRSLFPFANRGGPESHGEDWLAAFSCDLLPDARRSLGATVIRLDMLRQPTVAATNLTGFIIGLTMISGF